jgi:hypothetical protein
MKRLLTVLIVVGVFATIATRPAFSQDTQDASAQRDAFVKRLKAAVKYNATYNPRDQLLIHLRDGSKVVGRIREVHDEDFILEMGANQSPRTIAYTDLASAPERYTPMAEKIAEDTALGALMIILSPLLVLAFALGWQGE